MSRQGDNSLWDLRAVRELVAFLCVLAGLYLAYRIRATLLPIGFAFLLAYAVEPPVHRLRSRYGVPRGLSAALSLIVLLAGVGVFWAWAGPKLADQINELIDKLPDYADVVRDRLGFEAGDLDAFVDSLRSQQTKDVRRAIQLSDLAIAGARRMFGFVGTIAFGTLYGVFVFFAVIVFFFLFVTYRGWGRHLERVVPRTRRETVRKLVSTLDRALGVYVRGQLLVALFTFTGFSVGFFLADVPYWFVVALVGGVFSLVPYGQVLGPLVAITLKLLELQMGEAAFSWWGVLLAPLLVYGITQSLESWIITPLVQGEINKLHPALILTVLILGGSIAGVIGLVMAIPLTATIKVCLRDSAFGSDADGSDQQSDGSG